MSPRNPLDESLPDEPSPTSKLPKNPVGFSKKRKRGVDGEKKNANGLKKPKFKQKTTEEEEDGLDLSLRINKAFAHMDNHLLADYVANLTRKFESDLSSVELDDRYIPGSPSLSFVLWILKVN
jgi:protein CMS1